MNDAAPHLIRGALHADARGTVSFVNDFDLAAVQRFYIIRPRAPRGWIGHRRHYKWFTCIAGAVLIAAVQPDRWDAPHPDLPVRRFTLHVSEPEILCVPPGWATALTATVDQSALLVFSTGKIADATDGEVRFPLDTWPIDDAPATRA
jgi:dTDP-4-dehydrorhamnose 3,5-epimerase